MLLIKAEIQARQGQFTEAMETLRPLRAARIRSDVDDSRFFTVSSQQEAVTKILQERRRELAFTMRWYDIKRLNANEDTSDDPADDRHAGTALLWDRYDSSSAAGVGQHHHAERLFRLFHEVSEDEIRGLIKKGQGIFNLGRSIFENTPSQIENTLSPC